MALVKLFLSSAVYQPTHTLFQANLLGIKNFPKTRENWLITLTRKISIQEMSPKTKQNLLGLKSTKNTKTTKISKIT